MPKFLFTLLVFEILCYFFYLFFLELTIPIASLQPLLRPPDSYTTYDLTSGHLVDKQVYGKLCFHRRLSVNTELKHFERKN